MGEWLLVMLTSLQIKPQDSLYSEAAEEVQLIKGLIQAQSPELHPKNLQCGTDPKKLHTDFHYTGTCSDHRQSTGTQRVHGHTVHKHTDST